MSEAPDKDSQTEEATEKKISDAIEKGNVPVSKEAGTFAAMLATLLFCSFLVGDSLHGLIGLLGRMLDDPGGIRLSDDGPATANPASPSRAHRRGRPCPKARARLPWWRP